MNTIRAGGLRVLVAAAAMSAAFLCHAQFNNRQQDMMRQQQEQMRQQQQEQMRRQQQEQMREQMRQQQREQARAQERDRAREQARDQARHQQRDQARQQQREQAQQQARDQARTQQRQQAIDQQRKQATDQQRKQAADKQRQQTVEQQRKQATDKQRQQTVEQQRRQQTVEQQRKQAQSQQPGSPQAAAKKQQGPVVFSNGVAKLARPLTQAEISRGFTGKTTADGRALVRVQGRVFAVPASRVSGVKVASTGKTNWTPQQQGAARSRVVALAATGGGNDRSGSGGGDDGKGPKGIKTPFNARATHWSATETFEDHFTRHGRDFGAPSAANYAQRAYHFRAQAQREKLPTKVNDRGEVRIYDPKSNTFAVYGPDGATKSFYKPDPAVHTRPTNAAYWEDQKGQDFNWDGAPGRTPWKTPHRVSQ